MRDVALESLVERVRRLELQNRRLRRGVLAGLVALGAVLLMGQGAPKDTELVGTRLVLKDGEGTTRVEVGEFEDKSGPYYALVFKDESGENRAKLGSGRHGEMRSAGLWLSSSNGNTAHLNPTALGLSERDGNTADLSPHRFSLYTKERDVSASLDVWGKTGVTFELSGGKAAPPSLVIMDEGNQVWTAPR
ncbi:MAG: hypothetical protein ACE5JG_03240 [Planctomycetota bacterium]